MSSTHFVFLDNTTSVKLNSLRSAIDDSFLNNATVSMKLLDASGVEVGGETWPINLVYVSGSNGNYQGSFSDGVALDDNGVYESVIVAALPDGSKASWVEQVKAVVRNNDTQLNKWWPS